MTDKHITLIEQSFEERENLTPKTASTPLKDAIQSVITGLNKGTYRIAEKQNGQWQTHQWLKKAVLLAFRIWPNHLMKGQMTSFYDKVPLKYTHYTEAQFETDGARIVPHAMVRDGAYIGKSAVIMPSYINIGAFVGEGTMIDTWATVGSCAQIGNHVHISGGAGIGGVLEPLQANPTIIEDNCFIGARSEIVEGVIIEENSVISMGVFIGQSTKIYHRQTGDILYGRVPKGSVVIPGSLPSKDGKYHQYAAIIIKEIDDKTRQKVAINTLLRESIDD
jgi:2,3,4,5-tetrahydropyridine-2-carboxylate N-succinyltransferase